MASKTVTIDEHYFRTLLRRAELHASDGSDDASSVRIPQAIYDDLLRESREYHNLCRALVQGGVPPATLDILLQNDTTANDGYVADAVSSWPAADGKLFSKPNSQPIRFGKQGGSWGQSVSQAHAGTPHMRGGYSWADDSHQAGSWPSKRSAGHDMSPEAEDVNLKPWSEAAARKVLRDDNTLLFKHLPDTVTHKDITNLIRGGRLVDIWLRKNEHEAAVTFAEGAGDFLAWSRKNDLWLGGRRVEVLWSPRQFTITGQLSSKLRSGHSRNLVLRGAAGRLKEDQIREDMEHIHNLVLSAMVWLGGDLYISTNSIDKATFARNCMLSRLPYKGIKIEWYPDECAEALPKLVERPVPVPSPAVTMPKRKPVINRFNLLSLDDDPSSGGESETETADNASQLSGIPLARSTDTSPIFA